jgi:hypothetical protein
VTVQPPVPWRVELLGLIAAVEFRHPQGARLLWVDGAWWIGNGDLMRRTRAPAPAATMNEARREGCGWLQAVAGKLLP